VKLNVKSMTLRLAELDKYIARLKKAQGLSLEEYEADDFVQGAVERFFQAAIECCLDIAHHIISTYGFRRPSERRDIFIILAEAGYLEESYARDMVEMVQLRNRLVHLYWDIDTQKMHYYLQNDVTLLERFRAFTLAVIEDAHGQH